MLSVAHFTRLSKRKSKAHWPKKFTHRRYKGEHNFEADAFRSLSKGWNHLSVTVPSGVKDEVERLTKGLTPDGTNCAINVVFAIGIRLQLGRIQRDVVAPGYFKRLSIPTQAFLYALSTPFGLVPQSSRDQAGRIVQQALQKFDRVRFPRHEHVSVQSMLDVLVCRVPQVSWTQVKVLICCDGKASVEMPRKVQYCSSIYLGFVDGQTVADFLQRYFGQEESRSMHSRCSAGDSCKMGGIQRDRVLLDGTPPARLIVHLGERGILFCDDDRNKFETFEDIQLQIWSIGQAWLARYRVIGAIFVLENKHFVLRWKTTTQDGVIKLLHFDNGTYEELLSVDSKLWTASKWWTNYRRLWSRKESAKPETIEKMLKAERVLTLIYEKESDE